MENNVNKSKYESEDFDLNKTIGYFIGYWRLVLICMGIAALLAFFYLRYTVPLYKVHAKLLVEDQNNQGSSIFSSSAVSSGFGDLFNVQSSVDNEAEILKTRDLMEKVVRKLDLNITYQQEGQVRMAELYNKSPYKVVLVKQTDSLSIAPFYIFLKKENTYRLENEDLKLNIKAKFGDTIKVGGGIIYISRTDDHFDSTADYIFKIASIDGTVANYMNNFLVTVTGEKISTIDLELNSNLPKKGENVVNTLIQEYLGGNVQEKNKFADSTITFINTRLAIVNIELSDIENNVQSFKQSNNIANLEAQSNLIISNSGEYYNQLNQLDVQLEVVSTMLNYLSDGKNNARPAPALTGTTPDPTFSTLIERYNMLQAQRDRLLLNNTEINPYVQNVNAQLANARKDLYNNLQNQKNNLQIAKSKLVSENGTIANSIKKVPAQERQFLDLSRQQDIKQALFLYLLQKKEEVEVSKASNIAGARVIDHPKSEIYPYSPNKTLVIGGAMLAGFILPLGFAFLKMLFNTRVETKDDVQKSTSVPILGEISHNATEETIVVSKNSRNPIAEQFRALRTNLQFYSGNADENVILVTSSMPGEGKSFASLNLAMVLAISGKKVILLEMDLRKPNVAVQLPVTITKGFTNYIISPEMAISDIIYPSNIHENLFVMGSGPIPPNPAEILLSEKTQAMMGVLRKSFDYVIVDAPPIGVVTDAQLLSIHADLCIYLVRQKYTFKNQLQIPQDIYENKKMKKIALLINDISVKKGYGYNYGQGYNYGYGYGNENGKSKSIKIPFLNKKS